MEEKIAVSGSIANFKCIVCGKEANIILNDINIRACESAYCDEHTPRKR